MTSAAQLLVTIGADIAGAMGGLQTVSQHMHGMAAQSVSLSQRFQSMGQQAAMTGLMMTTGLTVPLAGVGVAALKTAMDSEGALNMMQAVSGATAEQMARVGRAAKDLGADMTLPATSAADAANAMTELAKAGLSVDDTLSAAKGTLQLAAAANIEEARAAQIAANALNAFKLPGKEAGDIVDMLAGAANASSIELTDAADSMKMASAVFAAFQGPVVGSKNALVDLTTAIGLLGNMGIRGSDAGTSLKQMLLQLAGPSEKSKDAMKALYAAALDASIGMDTLEKAMGNSKERMAAFTEIAAKTGKDLGKIGDIAYDASGRMRPLNEIVRLVAQGTRMMNDEQRNAYLTQIFGADATRAIIGLMREQGEGWDRMRTAVTRGGAAADLAGARMKGLGGALQGLQSQVETLLLEFTEPFLGTLNSLVRGVADFLPKLMEIDPALRNAGLAFAAVLAAAGPVLIAFGGLSTAIGFFLTPLGAVVLGLAALAAALASNFGGIRDVATKVLAEARPWFDWFGAVLGYIGKTLLKGDFAGTFAHIGVVLGTLQPVFQNLAQAALSWVSEAIPKVLATLGGLAGSVIGWVTSNAPAIARQFGIWAGAAWRWVTTTIPPLLAKLGELLGAVGNWIVGPAWETLKTKAGEWGGAIFSWVKDTLPKVPGLLGDILGKVTGWIRGTAWPAIRDTAMSWGTALFKWVEETLPKIPGVLLDILNKVTGWIAGAWQAISGVAVGWGTALFSWVKDITPKIPDKLKPILDEFKKWIDDQVVPTMLGALGAVSKELNQSTLPGIKDFMDTMKDLETPAKYRKAIDSLREGIEKLSAALDKLGLKSRGAGDQMSVLQILIESLGKVAAVVLDWIAQTLDALGKALVGIANSITAVQEAFEDLGSAIPKVIGIFKAPFENVFKDAANSVGILKGNIEELLKALEKLDTRKAFPGIFGGDASKSILAGLVPSFPLPPGRPEETISNPNDVIALPIQRAFETISRTLFTPESVFNPLPAVSALQAPMGMAIPLGGPEAMAAAGFNLPAGVWQPPAVAPAPPNTPLISGQPNTGSGPTIVHIEIRDGHFYNQRHIDDLVDQVGQRITQHLLPTAGVQFRR